MSNLVVFEKPISAGEPILEGKYPWIPNLPGSKAYLFHNAAFNSSGNCGCYTITPPPILFSKLNKKSY